MEVESEAMNIYSMVCIKDRTALKFPTITYYNPTNCK